VLYEHLSTGKPCSHPLLFNTLPELDKMTSARIILTRDPATTSVSLSRGESFGLTLDSLAALASALASAFVLDRIFRRIRKNGWSSLEALHISIVALFVAEVIHGIGQGMNLKWVFEGRAVTGTFCTAQGSLNQLGSAYAALATLTIAVQTFLTIWWLKNLSRTVSAYIIGIESLFLVLLVGIAYGIHTNPKENRYYAAPVPYWCYIGKEFSGQRIGGEYLWSWSALFVSLVLYFPLFLLYFGVIERGTSWYLPKADLMSTSRSPSSGDIRDESRGPTLPTSQSSIAGSISMEAPGVSPIQKDPKVLSTILYPIVYCILILPLSIVRWMSFSVEAKTGQMPRWPVATLTVEFIFSLSGVVNAFLYLRTRKRLFQPDELSDPSAPGIKMTQFATTLGENQ